MRHKDNDNQRWEKEGSRFLLLPDLQTTDSCEVC